MSKIESLTKEQEIQLAVYRDKWIKIGLCTDRVSTETVKYVCDFYYKKILGRNVEVPFLIMPSPLSAWKAVSILSQDGGKEKFDKIKELVKDGSDNLETLSFIRPFMEGQFDSHYFAFYDYMFNVLGIEIDSELNEKYDWYKKTTEMGVIYPLDDYFIVSDRPVEMHFKNKILHCDNGPAIKYSDGFGLYILNGVKVTKEIVETPSEKLDCNLIVTTENAEVKREIVRKIGVERIYEQLGGKTIDVQDDYELVLLNVKDGVKRPYLKMKNPSIGVYHLEGVHPDCKTVDDALNFRNRTSVRPKKLT